VVPFFSSLFPLTHHHHQIPCLPHSEEARKHHPLGFIPILQHRPAAIPSSSEPSPAIFEVYESAAIARYLDAVVFPSASSPCPSSDQQPCLSLRRTCPRISARIDTLVSIASDQLFRRLEFGVVKPRLAFEESVSGGGGDRNKAEFQQKMKEGVEALEPVLALFDQELRSSTSGFLVGDGGLTWADLYVYPPLADLKATPERAVLTKYPALEAWMARIEQSDEAKRTYEGTVASRLAAPPTAPDAKY